MKPRQTEQAHKAAQYDRIVDVITSNQHWFDFYGGLSVHLDRDQLEKVFVDILFIVGEKENNDK